MDTSWWLALLAVMVIALVAAVVDGRGRSPRRPGGRTRPPGRPAGPLRRPKRRPQPGEIWWADVPYADVPYEDPPGSKDRPCLVLSARGEAVLVAKITSRNHDERAGVIALPPGAVGDAWGRPSFLETDELREVGMWAFRRRVGVVNPTVWDQVRHLAACRGRGGGADARLVGARRLLGAAGRRTPERDRLSGARRVEGAPAYPPAPKPGEGVRGG